MTTATRTRPKRKRQPSKSVHPVTQYALDVVAGKYIVGSLLRKAAERHLSDLKRSDLVFDPAAADKVIQFFPFCKHSKGRWAGKPIILEPWQIFIAGSLFGWKRLDGLRRFNMAYIEVAKKNGKSTFAAVLGVYLAFYDGEAGSEVYAAATKLEQAKIVWGEADEIVKTSERLRRKIQRRTNNLHVEDGRSKFVPLGADKSNIDGLNTHAVIIDELHAWPKRTLWDTLETSTASRGQPLMLSITTAGYDKRSLCREQHDYGLSILSGTVKDDSYFVFIAALDEEDDWRNPAVWPKANPNLGVSVFLDRLIKGRDKAIAIPGDENSFRRYRLNQWTEQASRWLSLDLWDRGGKGFRVSALKGRRCTVGLDLARVNDVSALCLTFPPKRKREKVKAILFFWIPEATVALRVRKGQTFWTEWIREGWVTTTPGNTTDFNFITQKIIELHAMYQIDELSYDRMFAGEIIQTLDDEGVVLNPHGQGMLSMAGPCDELERLLLAEQIQHGGNPVLRWMAENVVVIVDHLLNKKPDKENSGDKIDGIMALLMSLTSLLSGVENGPSVYEERGFIVFGRP